MVNDEDGAGGRYVTAKAPIGVGNWIVCDWYGWNAKETMVG